MKMFRQLLIMAIAAATPTAALAQGDDADGWFTGTASFPEITSVTRVAASFGAHPEANSANALVFEALGGAVGSLVGIAAIALVTDCEGDDIACIVTERGAGVAFSAVGASLGTSLAARYTDSDRSTLGAAIGAVGGTAVGFGMHYLLSRSLEGTAGDKVVVPLVVLSQGALVALGSRLLGR